MNSIEDKFIITLSHCILTKGMTRAIACDLHRQVFAIIPIDLVTFIEAAENCTIGSMRLAFGIENANIIDEYLAFLIKMEFIFFSDFSDEQQRFPVLESEVSSFSIISNAVVEADMSSGKMIYKWFSSLIGLGCKHIEIRLFDRINEDYIMSLLDYFDNTEIMNINLVTPYQLNIISIDFAKYFLKNQRLNSIIFYNSPFEKQDIYHSGLLSINFTVLDHQLHLHCGIAHPSYFAISVPTYIESMQFNSCLNRKVAIDRKGNIKNCPSRLESHGNINHESLLDVLTTSTFQKLWNINKDQISTCKVCEFRHICTDCRAFLEDPKDLYSKPLKCGYDPYTNIWEDWSTNPIKQMIFEKYKEKAATNNA